MWQRRAVVVQRGAPFACAGPSPLARRGVGCACIVSDRRCYASSKDKTVGFIGLGNMGAHMARNLRKAGYPLVVFDVNEAAMRKLEEAGAEGASSPREVAKKATAIVTMLPSPSHVESVYGGNDGVFKSVQEGALLVDASTIDPGTALKVSQEAAKYKAVMVDAPVSGGVGGAEAGTLTFMVGGTKEAFESAKPLLQCMGKNIVHCGANGSGQSVKLCNNLVLAISMIGVSEAMNLGVQLGLDPKVLAGIFNTSSARCWSSDTYNPVPGVMPNVPASRDYTGGFGVDLMAKDLGLALNAAESVDAALPLTGAAHRIYKLISQKGMGGKDFSVTYKFLKEKGVHLNDIAKYIE